MLTRALCDYGLSQVEFARMNDARPQHIGRMLSPHHDTSPTLADVVTYQPRSVALRLIRWAADRLGVEVSEREAVEGSNHLLRLSVVDREAFEARSTHSAAVADGYLSDSELHDAAREHREAADAHAREAAWFEGQLAERRRAG